MFFVLLFQMFVHLEENGKKIALWLLKPRTKHYITTSPLRFSFFFIINITAQLIGNLVKKLSKPAAVANGSVAAARMTQQTHFCLHKKHFRCSVVMDDI